MPSLRRPSQNPRSIALQAKTALRPSAMLLACAAALLSQVPTGIALAQPQTTAATAREITVALPAQPLAQTIDALARLAGVGIGLDTSLATGRNAPAIQGTMTLGQALERALAGSGLAASSSGSGVSISKAGTNAGDRSLAPITVKESAESPGDLPKAYAGAQVARGGRVGLLGNADVFDTPFNITSYTSQLIEDQGARTISDVIANDPSIRNATNRNTIDEKFLIRGFNVNTTDISFDGLYGISSSRRNSLESIERVEVLKGPNALLNGIAPFGSIGGAINLVPKRATDIPISRISANYAEDATLGTHVDIGRRFGTDNAFGARLNVAHSDGDTAIDRQSEKQIATTLALDYKNDRLRLNANFGYDEAKNRAQPLQTSIAPGIAVPRAPKASTNYQQDWEYQRAERTYGTVRGELDVLSNLTASFAFGRAENDEESVFNAFRILDTAGRISAPYESFRRVYDTKVAEAGLRATLATGAVKHRVVLTLSDYDLKQSSAGFEPDFSITSNLYNPVLVARPPEANFSNLPKTGERKLRSAALADTMSFMGDRVQLTLALRQQSVKVGNYDESALTPAIGLVVKPQGGLSLYANYIEGLAQGPTAPLTGVANPGEVFAPFKSKQYEVGAKVDFNGLGATVALFQIAQPSAFRNPATTVFGVDGEQRNRGLEVNLFGQPYAGIRLLGGVQFLDGELTRTAGGINDGKTAIGAPKTQLNLGAEWDTKFASGLTLTGRVIHTSGQFVDIANTQRIPSWARVDIGARYKLTMVGQVVNLRANVLNLFNRNYWESVPFAGSLVLGAPRTVLLSAAVDF